jgi:hypothetical protein
MYVARFSWVIAFAMPFTALKWIVQREVQVVGHSAVLSPHKCSCHVPICVWPLGLGTWQEPLAGTTQDSCCLLLICVHTVFQHGGCNDVLDHLPMLKSGHCPRRKVSPCDRCVCFWSTIVKRHGQHSSTHMVNNHQQHCQSTQDAHTRGHVYTDIHVSTHA